MEIKQSNLRLSPQRFSIERIRTARLVYNMEKVVIEFPRLLIILEVHFHCIKTYNVK